MNDLLGEFVEKMKGINGRADLESVYHWLWGKQLEIAQTAHEINRRFGLDATHEVKPDLPCLGVGSHTELVVLAANPGWEADGNSKEDAYCKGSPAQYVELMFDFFKRHPEVTERYSSWWTRALRYVTMLPSEPELLGRSADKWARVHEEQLLGGWELFPWHSTQDGVTSRARREPWLNELCCESIRAVLRLKPRLLFVVSIAGYDLVREDLFPDLQWDEFELGLMHPANGAYAKFDSDTEIVAIRRQLLARSARRDFGAEDLIEEIRESRARAR